MHDASMASSCHPKPSGCTGVFLTGTCALQMLMIAALATVFRCHPCFCRKGEIKSKIKIEYLPSLHSTLHSPHLDYMSSFAAKCTIVFRLLGSEGWRL